MMISSPVKTPQYMVPRAPNGVFPVSEVGQRQTQAVEVDVPVVETLDLGGRVQWLVPPRRSGFALIMEGR